MKQMGVQDLPVDIWMSICYFMDPLDILFLSQTCSALRVGTREHFVWWDAMEESISRNHIFSRAFNTSIMTLQQLQDATTAPSRVLSKLRKGGPPTDVNVDKTIPPSSLYPHSTCLIRASDLQCDPRVAYESWNSKAWQHFEHVWVIPGGRFIVAYTHREIVFYDLRELTPIKYRGEPLRVRCDDSHVCVPSPSADGREIRVAAIGDEWSGDEVTILRLVFGDSGDNGTPRVIRHSTSLDPKIEERRDIQLFVLTHDFFICYYTPKDSIEYDVLCVWDYKQDMFAVWNVARKGYKKLYFDNDHVVLVTSTSLMGWHIPPLRRRHQNLRLQEVPPTFIVPLTYDVHADDIQHCESLSDWYNTSAPSFFDLMSATPSLHSWLTFRTEDPTDSYLASKQFIYHAKEHFKMGSHGRITFNPYTLCNDYVVKTFVGRPGRIFVLTCPSPNQGGDNDGNGDVEPEEDKLAELLLPKGYDLNPGSYAPGQFSFDATSGKLAYLWGRDQTSIVVLDYLKHPGELS